MLFASINSSAQFYFKPDTIHEWEVDTLFGKKGNVNEVFFYGVMKSELIDSVYNSIQIRTDSLGMVHSIGYSIGEVGGMLFFDEKNNDIASAGVFDNSGNRSSMSVMTNAPYGVWSVELTSENRRKIESFNQGTLRREEEKIFVENEWKTVFSCIYYENGEPWILEKLDHEGTGYHLEYDDKGNVRKSWVIVKFQIFK